MSPPLPVGYVYSRVQLSVILLGAFKPLGCFQIASLAEAEISSGFPLPGPLKSSVVKCIWRQWANGCCEEGAHLCECCEVVSPYPVEV